MPNLLNINFILKHKKNHQCFPLFPSRVPPGVSVPCSRHIPSSRSCRRLPRTGPDTSRPLPRPPTLHRPTEPPSLSLLEDPTPCLRLCSQGLQHLCLLDLCNHGHQQGLLHLHHHPTGRSQRRFHSSRTQLLGSVSATMASILVILTCYLQPWSPSWPPSQPSH